MSHYTVLVIQKPAKDKPYKTIEDILAPYDEGISVAPYVDMTYDDLVEKGRTTIKNYIKREEEVEKFENETVKKLMARVKAGELVSDPEYHDFIVKHYGYKINSKGEAMTTYNPNSKWDWYSIGGRWDGMLQLKSGERVDSACVEDLDWEKMSSIDPEDRIRAEHLWKYYVEGEEYPGTEKDKREEFGFILYKPEYYKERYKTLEGYIKSISTWTTWAVVDDAGWYEPGKMGWWAMSDASIDDERNWDENYYERFIKDLPGNTIVTVVDCHI